MRTPIQILFLIPVFLLSMGMVSHGEEAIHIEVFPKNVKQGNVCFVRVSVQAAVESITAQFRGERFPLPPAGRNGFYEGLLGIDMNTEPSTYELTVVAAYKDGKVETGSLSLPVRKVVFKTQTLSLPSSMVDLDPETLERVTREEKQLKALFRGVREERLWSGPFILPVPGEISTPFGLHRIINGQPRNAHTGVDLRGEEGSPVLACNRGVVVLVDQQFFSGKSILLDHGWGLYSMYFHLSETTVREGERVNTGTLIGRVGSTGRSKGAHLHWGVQINGAKVDPFSLLSLTRQLRE